MELAISKTKKLLIQVLGADNAIALKRKAMYCMLWHSMFKDRLLFCNSSHRLLGWRRCMLFRI